MNTLEKLLLCSYLYVSFQSHSQTTIFDEENLRWYPGEIQLTDGSIIEDSINYNFVTGIVSQEIGDELYTYYAENVLRFSILDSSNRSHLFYSLPFRERLKRRTPIVKGPILNGRKKPKKPVFFEVLFEKEHLAILSRSKFSYDEKFLPRSHQLDEFSSIQENHTMKIERMRHSLYIANNEGNIELFSQSDVKTYKNIEGDYVPFWINERISRAQRNDKYDIVNRSVLKANTGDYYKELINYAYRNNIDFGKPEGLIDVLNYYFVLLENDPGQ